jgi:transaldolase/glucose-6-phosphate isomerase
VRLGALLGGLAFEGRDKMTLRASYGLASFGSWAEQLVAESTGKEGRGVVPVVEEPGGAHASRDRVYVDVVLRGDAPPASPLAPQAHDTIFVDDAYGLGGLFFRFELATATAGVVLGVNPFDEPNVAEAKAATNAVLAGGSAPQTVLDRATGTRLRAHAPAAVAARLTQGGDAATWIRDFAALAAPGDYVALLAYVARRPGRHALLQEIRASVSRRARAAATLGYGPRYLHSTGQLHKGGAANGLFVLLTHALEDGEDLAIPGKPFTFGRLLAAQAEGDLRTLAARGRRVLEVRLDRPVDEALVALRDALR